jgi:mono/diheme cytochrome c family protein
LVVCAVLVSACLVSGRTNPVLLQGEQRAQATALYTTHCSGCHGPAGQGVVGPRLLGRDLIEKYPTPEHQAELIATGTARGMPPFRQHLSMAEMVLLARFTQEFR